jgi:hypothetical protein
MAIVNSNYEFTYVDVGKNGRISDGGVIESTIFYELLNQGKLHLPKNEDTVKKMNFVFLADEAFSSNENILKPYSQRELDYEKRIFNYRLSRARNCVENAFGLIAARFRVLQSAIHLAPEKATYIVLAICILHNFLRKRGGSYISSSTFDREDNDHILQNGEWRDSNSQLHGLQPTRNASVSMRAKMNREQYKDFFNNEGSVEWQDNILKLGRA